MVREQNKVREVERHVLNRPREFMYINIVAMDSI